MLWLVVAVALGTCPDPSVDGGHEGPRDCPWAAIARAAETGDAARVLAEAAPKIWRDAARDRAASALHAAWGTSRNFDEHVKASIVAPPILEALGQRLGVNGRGEVLHAGLQHTYGYLFSTLWTSFGYKRARWVDGELERGLGLPDGLLGPAPKAGTLYANVTCTLAKIAFDDGGWQRLAPACARSTATEIMALRTHQRAHDHWLERAADVILRTDLYPLSPSRYLLVYAAVIDHEWKLLTSFPVDEAMAQSLRAQPTGDGLPISARYNAVVPGLVGPVTGSRTRFSTR